MFLRLLSLTLVQLLAVLAAWYVVPAPGAPLWILAAALVASYVWLLLDMARGRRVLRWLRDGAAIDLSMGWGIWSEVVERMRHLLRAREKQGLESKTRLQDFLAALQASPNGVVLLDADYRIEWFNQMASSHFGFEPQRDILQHFTNLVRDPALVAYFAARDFTREMAMPGRENSNTKPVRLSVHLHPYGDGRCLLLSRDVTAVEQAEAMRRDFVANVSHEIRTPLTVLAGFVETLQTLPLQEAERQRYLDLMAHQAQRMQSLVSDLLTLSRLEGSPLPSPHEWVSVSTLLAQCLQEAHDLSQLLYEQPQDLVCASVESVELAGSAVELHSALFNLLGNAVRYSPPQTRIRVQWQLLPSGGAVFSVSDQGPGIAAEHLARLTERFYRVDRSRSRDTGGTGLGLAIVKHVAQRHGAELQIDSAVGQGSTFSLSFPAHRVRRLHQELALES